MTQETGDGASGGSASVERGGGTTTFDAVAAAAEEGIFRLDADGRFEAVNDVVVDRVGYDRAELIGEGFALLSGEEDVEAVEAALRELRSGDGGRAGDDGRVCDVVVSVRTSSGEQIPCELRLAAVEADGRFDGAAGVLRTGTDRRRDVEGPGRERSALASELDEALDRVSDAFFALDADGRFTYVNERAGELLEREPETLVGEAAIDEFPEAEDTPFVENALRTLETGAPVAFEEFYGPLSAWFEVRVYPSETGVSVYFRDVTEEKRRESVLEQYETVVEAVEDGLYAVDEDYRFTLVNDAYCRLTGYDRGELLGEHISTVVDGETVEMAAGLREELVRGEVESGSVEVEVERADGERVTVESRYAPMPGDEFGGTVGVVRDVSERKAFEETLTALNEASRELHAAETDEAVGEVVLRTLTDVLDLSAATVFRYDEETDRMVPEHQTSGAVATDQEIPPLPAGDESLTGHVFELGEFRSYDDIRETPYVEEPKTEMRAGLFAPIREDRILVVSSTEPGAFDERTERLVELLAGNAASALERLEREREVRESERRYRTLVDNFPNGAVALYDEECHYVAVGGQMYDRIDLSPEDAVGMTVGERLSGEIAEALESVIQRAFEGESDEVEAPYDGREFRLQSLPIRDDDGDVILAMVVTQDVTERKKAQEALEESERRFRTMMEQSPLSTQIFDPDGNALMVNPAWEELWQAESEDVGEYNVLEDEQLEAKGLMPYLERGFDGEATQLPPVYYDPEEIGKEGRARWVEAFVYPVVDESGDIREVVLVHNDVTESRDRERELEQYETIVETVDDGVYVLDDGRFVFVNEAFAEMVGYDREELIGADVSMVTTGEYADVIEEEVRRLEEGDVSVGTVETEVATAGGEPVPVEARFSLFPLEDGSHGRVGITRDLSDRKERERELERYERIVENLPVGVYRNTPGADGEFVEANSTLASIFDADSVDELMEHDVSDLYVDPDRRAEFSRTLEREGMVEGFELKLETLDGDTIWVSVTAIKVEEDGEVYFDGTVQDITERKRAQQRLEEERDMFAEGPTVVMRWGIGESWPVEYVSDNVEEVLGYTPGELESGDVQYKDLLLDEEVDRITREVLENSDETTERFSHEPYRIETRDGDVRWVKDVTKIIRDETGDITHYLGYLVDITERKERERELAEQHERYRGLVENAPVPIATYDAEGRLTYVNDAGAELVGADDPDELVGEPALELIHPDDRDEAIERMGGVVENREPAPPKETKLLSRDGEVRYAIIASAPITQEGEPGGQVVLSDVTDRKEYERALEESEQRYRTLIENFPNGAVALVDRSLRYQTVGGSPRDIAGTTVEELEGSPVTEVLPQELADELVPNYEAALRGESREIEAEFEGRAYRFQFVPVRDEEGDILAALGMSQDITERRRHERALEESEQRYRTLVESYPGGAVAMFDEDLRYTAAGGQLLEAEDVDPEERIGQSIFELYPDDLVEEIEPHFRAALEGETNSFEVEYLGRDLFNYTLPVGNPDGEVFGGMLVVNDVTEQREYERTLERFRTMIETVDDGVYTIDSNGRITMANAAYAEMTGYHREELIGMHASDLVQEEVHERAREIEEELVEGEADTARLTADLETADGEAVTAEATFALLPGDDEEYERVAVVRDVTERVERERELERALDLLDKAQNVAKVGGWELDAETMEVYWTEQTFDLLGFPDGEEPPLDEALEEVYHPEDRPLVEEALEEALSSGEPFDVEVRFFKDDELHWARIWGVPEFEDGELVRLRGAFQDVTERVERERELERALDLLHHTEEIADVGGWELDPETQDVFWTEHTFELQGIPPGEEPPVEEALDVYHPEDRSTVEEGIERALESGEPMDVEVRYIPRDRDEVRWFRLQAVPEVVDGEVVSFRGVAQDVTERVERERELKQYEILFEESTDVNAVIDPDGTFRYLTPSITNVLGYDQDELVGENAFERIHPDDRDLAMEEFAALIEDPEYGPAVEIRYRHENGQWVDLDVRANNLLDEPAVGGVVAYTRDISELKEREQEIRTRFEQQQVVTDLGKKALEDIDLDRLFDEAVERVAETLGNEYAKVLELQPDGDSLLLRSGVGWRDGLVGEGTVGTGDDSQAGHTIRSEEPIVVTDLEAESRFSGPALLTSHGVESGISTIIGPADDPWGVLGTHHTERREFSQQDVNFVQSVANILATAIDRRTRERQIEGQRNQMAAIVRLSEIVQEVDQAVIEQSSREEIDRLVCEHLVESGEYAAAWIGDVNLASERIVPRAVAGVPDDQVDERAFDSTDEGSTLSPTATAAASGETGVARVDADAADSQAIPEFARERGYRSMAAVPLSFEDVRYGVLTLFSNREDAFEGYERTIIEQLGRTVGHAINAIDRKQALVGDSFTELELRLPGVVESLDVSAGQGSGDGDPTITVEGTVATGGDTVIQYVSVTGVPPDEFETSAAELPAVETVRHIGGDGPDYRYEVTYSDPPITSTLTSYGGRIETLSFDVPDLRVTVALPTSADVRQIVQSLRSEFPDVRIDAQRTVTREGTSTEEYRSAIEDALTERQRTALMTAFFAGYFEWSRDSTGEEVAETLGVSPSTFHQHLRAAQRKVIATLFEDEQAV